MIYQINESSGGSYNGIYIYLKKLGRETYLLFFYASGEIRQLTDTLVHYNLEDPILSQFYQEGSRDTLSVTDIPEGG